MRGSQARIWFVAWPSCWWAECIFNDPRVYDLSMRPLRLLNASLIYETCSWVSRLRKFYKSSCVKFRREFHVNFVFYSLDACLLCWALCLKFQHLVFSQYFHNIDSVFFFLQWGILLTLCLRSDTLGTCVVQIWTSLSASRRLPQYLLGRTKSNRPSWAGQHINSQATSLGRTVWIRLPTLLRKPNFFFSNSINEDEEVLYDGNYKWLH